MSFEELTDERQVLMYLGLITGHKYVIATGSGRKWGSEDSRVEHGTFYQIMPDSDDDGFFDWYCEHRMHNQFFKSIDTAVLHFVFYHHIWKAEVKE
ncbi:hypothetical protein [Spirosoma arcticum]